MFSNTLFHKLWSTLSKPQRKSAIILMLLMLCGMLFEMLGIGLIIPVLTTVTNKDLYFSYPDLKEYLEFVGSPSQHELVIYTMLILAMVYTLKSIFLSFLTWQQAKYTFGVQANFSHRLFKGYLYQPYTFHLQKNSAELIRNIVSEVGMLSTVIQSILIIITEVLVYIGILTLLLLVEPIGALLVMILFGIAGLSYYSFVRGYILHWGEARQSHEGLRFQHLQQGLGGIKDIKILGREQEFLRRYEIHNSGSAYVSKMQSTFMALPRFLLELLAILSLLVLVIFMVEKSKPLDSLIPVLGVFAAAAFRMMPSVNRLLNAYQSLRYSLPVINTIHTELKEIREPQKTLTTEEKFLFKKEISLNNISYSYPNTDRLSLDNISMTIPNGLTVGIIGASGAGKSTLIDIILGLLEADSGKLEVDGIDVVSNARGWQKLIGYVPQTIYLTDDTLRQNIALGIPDLEIDNNKVVKAAESAQLEDFINNCADGIDAIVGERGIKLSGGQRQRIGIARALYHDPDVLVLDEATSSLDTNTETEVMNSVSKLHGKKTVIIVAHRLSTVRDCDYLYKIEQGKIISQGQPEEILDTKQ